MTNVLYDYDGVARKGTPSLTRLQSSGVLKVLEFVWPFCYPEADDAIVVVSFITHLLDYTRSHRHISQKINVGKYCHLREML